MVSWWMDNKNKDRSFYIGNDTKIKEIDTLLLSIKPPSEITRTPRSLFDRKLWKASEWKNFLLYYSFSCLQSVNMPKKYLHYWFLLVYSINIFLQEQFSEIEFIKATKALRKFVLSIENIYGTPELMKYNFHLFPQKCEKLWRFMGCLLFLTNIIMACCQKCLGILTQFLYRFVKLILECKVFRKWHQMNFRTITVQTLQEIC